MGRARLLTLAALFVTVAVPAESNPKRLVFVGSSDFAPYQYLDAQGEPRGFNIELMQALARETGIPIEIRLVATTSVLPFLERGEADLVCFGYSARRAQRFTLLLPLWRLRQVALVRADRASVPQSLLDMRTERLIEPTSSILREEIAELPETHRPRFVEASTLDRAAEALLDSSATLFLGNWSTVVRSGVIGRHPGLRQVEWRAIPYYLAAGPGREDLVQIFLTAYVRLQESGEFSAIVERTLLTAEHEHRWWDPWSGYVAGASAVAVLAFLAIVGWNRSLRTQVGTRTEEIRAVAERLKFHSHILSQVTDAIIVLSDERRVTTWNAGAELVFGISAAEAMGRAAEDILTNLTVVEDITAIRETVAASGFWRGETVIRRRDGEKLHVEAIVQALRDAEGRPAGRLIVVHDIHARKLADVERRRLEHHLQQAKKLESLGVLAGGIAHDFNNLLVGMLGHAGLALMEVPPESPLRDRIQQIETCALRAAELTNQMLAYSGKGRFIVQPTDLTAVVCEMSNLLQTAISKSARLELHLAESLPAMSADGTQLRQVVMNLITNASDAIGGRVGTIAITTGVMQVSREYLAEAYASASNEAGEYVYLEVRDTGCGMDAETQQRMFDPFFTTKFTGRGLGLAAVLGIVRGHRGAVHIRSAPGNGTTFRVLFPACGLAAEAPAAKPGRLRARKQARVLVVDDEPSVRAIARETLTRAGFTVFVAADGPEAIDRVKAGGPAIDAALIDMTLPGLNGIETMRALRELVEDLPVVLISGYSEQEAADRCAGEVLAGFIQKPFPPATLVEKLNDVIAPL